jgi:hypothetical protein
LKSYGEVPPETDVLIDPFMNPLQVTFTREFVMLNGALG